MISASSLLLCRSAVSFSFSFFVAVTKPESLRQSISRLLIALLLAHPMLLNAAPFVRSSEASAQRGMAKLRSLLPKTAEMKATVAAKPVTEKAIGIDEWMAESNMLASAEVLPEKSALANTAVMTTAAPATMAGITITRTSAPIFFADGSTGINLTCNYASFQITSATGETDLWVKISNLTTPYITLAPSEDGVSHLGAFTAGQTKFFAFYLCETSVGSTTQTAVQSYTISAYNTDPSLAGATLQASKVFNYAPTAGYASSSAFSVDPSTIAAAANKVNIITYSPSTIPLGGALTIHVEAETGTIGAAGALVFSPNATPGWPVGAYELTSSLIKIYSGTTCTGTIDKTLTDTLLLLDPAISGNRCYTIDYTYKAVGTTTGSYAVAPIGWISSGTQIKHTGSSSATSFLVSPTNTTTLAKTVSPASLLSTGGTVTYTVTLTNTSTVPVRLDKLVDVLPTSPAASTYVANSAKYNAVSIENPAISGSTLTWIGTYTVPAGGTAALTYQVNIPATFGSYNNSAVGFIGTTQIDKTLSTSDNSPATATVTVVAVDYGDAPDTAAGTGAGNYETIAANGGPSHTIIPGLGIGTSVDNDSGSLQNATANADDSDQTPDDEDGIASFPALDTTSGATYTVAVNVTNTTGSPAYLVGYLDFNKDGDFLDTGEKSATVTVNASGSQNVTVTTPTGMTTGTTFARFRLSATQVQAESSLGAATSGEVEDYQVTIISVPVVAAYKSVKLTTDADASGSITAGDTLSYTLQYVNTGNGGATNFQITDLLPAGISITATGTQSVTVSGSGTTAAANTAYTGGVGAAVSNLLASGATLAVGGVVTVTIPVRVNTGFSGSVTNQASGTGTGLSAAVFTDNAGVTADLPSTVTAAPYNLTIPAGSVTQTITGTVDPTTFAVLAITAPSLTLRKSVNPTGDQLPGTELTYSITFTNTGGSLAREVVLTDPIPIVTDFKIGSVTTDPGSTGLTIVVEYSNDYDSGTPTAATWTYTPVSGGGGAATNFDRDVKAVRWRVTAGFLSSITPDNSGKVGFTVIIR